MDDVTVEKPRVVLRIDSGADHANSVSRKIADALTDRLIAAGATVLRREATEGLPVVTGSWVDAAFFDGEPSALSFSNALVDELLTADELILVAPVYNFGVPAAMKAYIDQVVRAGRTFRFTASGPEGLVPARRAWIVTASGATTVGSEFDFNTTYLRAVLGFIGIPNVHVVAADGLQFRGQQALEDALAAVAAADVATIG